MIKNNNNNSNSNNKMLFIQSYNDWLFYDASLNIPNNKQT